MFRLHRTRPSKSGERIDFKFSHFKALQVPKGWDKLYVSIMSVETGKMVAKSSKATVRNGNCQWAETLSESIWVSQDESSNDFEDCLFKLVVAMGSARSGILGEATVNMTNYMSSSASNPVSFPLKKCSHGTTLQVKIHCLTPRIKLREKGSSSPKDDVNADSCDIDTKSAASDSSYAKSVESYSSKDLDSNLPGKEPGSKETSFSALGSQHSYDSAEASLEGENFSTGINSSGEGHKPIRTQESQDSTCTQASATPITNHVDSPHSNHCSFNSRSMDSVDNPQKNEQDYVASSLRLTTSSKDLLEAAEDTIEELRAEAKMWERNAQKLMLDLDILRKEFSDQFKTQENLEIELSAVRTECDGLNKEVEQLNLMLEKSIVKQTAREVSTFQEESITSVQKELEDELRFQKEANANLALQLKKSQESNIELVSILQELEETIEKQRVDIEEYKNCKLENGRSFGDKTLVHIEKECRGKDEEIISLKAKLSETRQNGYPSERQPVNGGDADLIREIELLKEKLQELERDCNELTTENLELLFKLKEVNNTSPGSDASIELSSNEVLVEQESRMHYLKEKMTKKVLKEIEGDYDVSIKELERLKMELQVRVTELGKELAEKESEIEKLEAKLLGKEEEIEGLKQCQTELEAKVSDLQTQKVQLEENMEIILKESQITTRCLNDLQNEIMVLSNNVNSHVSANRTLERKSSQLEDGKRELELHLAELKGENLQLSTHVTGLEAQLRYLTDEKESSRAELENSKSLAMSLGNKVMRLKNEIETQKLNLKQKLEDLHSQWLETQEECEYLRRANPKLQAAVENLREECSSLQRTNGELKTEKLELHEHYTNLEAKLRESHITLADYSKRIEVLEEDLSLIREDYAVKEKSLTSELDALIDENREHKEKLILGESLLNQMYAEKKVEVESLQHEVENLTKQLSATQDERDRICSDAVREASSLHADKVVLESSLQEMQSKLRWTDNELITMQAQHEKKERDLMEEIAASKQSQEMLMADREKAMKLLEHYKSREEKLKTVINDLELKLTVSQYERQQLMEESTNLKVRLLRIEHLQDEVLTLKNELNSTKSEKEKLKTSLQLISGECEELKKEKITFMGKISSLEWAMMELEDCRSKKVALEGKLLRMEGDLMAREALCAQSAEIKNEIARISRANRQYEWKIQQLEEENNNVLKRAQALEEELKLAKEEKQKQREFMREEDGQYENYCDESPEAMSKIELLENELAKAREANNMYKIQLNRLLSDNRSSRANASRKSSAEGEVVAKERYERTKSSLEGELRDIRERYLHMSLKYAEVEAQREELVMKLRLASNGKRWFSMN